MRYRRRALDPKQGKVRVVLRDGPFNGGKVWLNGDMSTLPFRFENHVGKYVRGRWQPTVLTSP